jgi:hypothetical protein
MLATWPEGIFMRLLCAVMLASSIWVLPWAFDRNGAAALEHVMRPSAASDPGLVLKAGFVCGNFDGHFTCKSDPGAGQQYGKNAGPGPITRPDETPDGVTGAPAPATTGAPADQGTWQATTPDAASTCQHGMVGTPPNCECPQNSELLGGNCVHYTASACSNGLASDALPQACRRVEEKLACKLRDDGLKDCCCVTYDQF